MTIHNDDYLSDEERIKGNCHWWFSEKHEPKLYVMLAELSARTLVTLGWQEELEFVISQHVGQKIATRALKEELGLNNAKVTEDQIGRYMGKSGLHTKVDKVNYTQISRDGMKPTMRLSGWLIGGDAPPSMSAKPSLQKQVNSMFDGDDVGETPAKPVEPVLVLSSAQEVAQVVMASAVGEDDPFMDPSAWSLS